MYPSTRYPSGSAPTGFPASLRRLRPAVVYVLRSSPYLFAIFDAMPTAASSVT
jgi:hypothetical protein